ncbi:hypothetical protein [Isobaculum melis]|uniref:Uncharacterized protein n=1 Tax=Isobaculum melis TaxID=142588 RepID=A0A1H9PXJ1_9LACT|nr:hypothetical protein [Isobaculum melis]SER52927.1 hypothetical protein SAMN04488559_101215 [Isobaculum melis]
MNRNTSPAVYILAFIGALVLIPFVLGFFGLAIGLTFALIFKVAVPVLVILGIVYLIGGNRPRRY